MEVVASLSQGRTAAAQCGLFTHKSVRVIFEPPCIQQQQGVPPDVLSPSQSWFSPTSSSMKFSIQTGTFCFSERVIVAITL